MKEIEQAPKSELKPRRKFDDAFKRDAVALWLSSGKSARQIAAELGLAERHLYQWKKTHTPTSPATQAQMEAELAALRRENALLRQQRDVLKKTLGILSEAPSNASNGSRP